MTDYALHDWQQRDVNRLAQHGYTGFFNVQPGGGKTVTAVGAARQSGASTILVVAPEGTYGSAWAKWVGRLADAEIRKVGNGKKAEQQAMADLNLGYPGWYFTTPQLLTRTPSAEEWAGDLLIVDEGHMLNAAQTKGQRRLSGFSPADGVPFSKRFGARQFLSGTPLRTSFERAWATMRFLWPNLYNRGEVAYDNYYRWLADRMNYEMVYTNQRDRNGEVKTAKRWLTEKEPGRLLSEAPLVIQHFRREHCCDAHPTGFLTFDEPNVVDRTVPLLPAQKRAIAGLEEQYLGWVEDNPLVVDLSITQKQRIRQVCLGVPVVTNEEVLTEDGEAKIKSHVTFPNADQSPFADEVESILEQVAPEPVTIFLESQQFAAALVARLNAKGIPAFEYSGKTAKTRDEMLSRYGKDYRVAVVTLASGGTGLDGLQEVSYNEIWLERHVDDVNNEQAEARQDRMGARRQIQRFVIHDDLGYADGRLSEQIEKRLRMRKSTRVAQAA